MSPARSRKPDRYALQNLTQSHDTDGYRTATTKKNPRVNEGILVAGTGFETVFGSFLSVVVF